MTEEVRDAGNLQKYFSSIPHLVVDDSQLTRDDRALYLYYKRVAGENGECYQSNKTVAKGAGLGPTLMKECRAHLLEHGYIEVAEAPGATTVITIVDRWDENFAAYAGGRSATGGGRSATGGGRVATPLPGRVATPTLSSGDTQVVAPRQGGGRVATPKKNTLKKNTGRKILEEKPLPLTPSVVEVLANRDPMILLYEKHVGMATPLIHDDLVALPGSYPMDWLTAAFEKSAGKSLAYAKGILRRWDAQGHMDVPKVTSADRIISEKPESASAQFLRRYQERERSLKGIPA